MEIDSGFYREKWRYIIMKKKPKTETVTQNNYMRFEPLYKCYCPVCNKLLKRSEEKCTCGQEIDWSEWQ